MREVIEILAWVPFAWCVLCGAIALFAIAMGYMDEAKEKRRLRLQANASKFLDQMAERESVRWSIDWLKRTALKNKELGEDAHKRIGDNRKRVDLLEAYLDERLSAIEAKVFKCR